jgi:hypothetical protein
MPETMTGLVKNRDAGTAAMIRVQRLVSRGRACGSQYGRLPVERRSQQARDHRIKRSRSD